MGKLKAISAPLRTLAPRVATGRDVSGHSYAGEPWRRWYSTARWERLRQDVFLRDGFTCQCGCRRLILAEPERVADHVREHKGDPRLFWDRNNLQTLWKPHHDGWKQRLERRRAARP
jgi:5-methylcytosine-specific restriction enzyme A